MRRQPTSDLEELLKLLRRILVLAIAVYGLAREMPYITLAIRLGVLWAILYISSGLIDVVFRRLSYHASMNSAETTVSDNPGANLPAAKENRAG